MPVYCNENLCWSKMHKHAPFSKIVRARRVVPLIGFHCDAVLHHVVDAHVAVPETDGVVRTVQGSKDLQMQVQLSVGCILRFAFVD